MFTIGLTIAACARRGADPFAVQPTQPYAVEAGLLDQMQRYQAGQSRLEALSGRARGTAHEGRKRRPFKQAFALRPPSSLRIEVTSSVGQTVALFVCDGTTLYYRQQGQDDPFEAPASAEAVEQTLGFALEVEELVDTLLGRMRPAPVQVGQSLPRAGDVVFVPDASGSQRLEYGFDLRGGVLRSRTYRGEDGSREVVVLYEEYTSVEGQVVPARVHLRNLRTGDGAELTTTRLNLNPSLRPEAFRPPPGR